MTIFITEFFKLDLSHLNIKFSEENSFFEKDLIKQHSFPFKIPKQQSFMPFFEFIGSHNSIESNKYIKGTLFRNDKYYEAELLVLEISEQIEALIYYRFEKLSIFDKNLKNLPWETLEIGNSIHSYAEQTIIKDYPNTVINFPTIYAPDLYKDYDFGDNKYAGFINHNVDGSFFEVIFTYYTPLRTHYKMNEMRPFIYLKEIVKFIFSQIDYTLVGDFMSNASISKCLLYHENSIFYTNKDYTEFENLSLTLSQSNVSGYYPSSLTYNEYTKSMTMVSYGSYKVKLNVQGELSATGGSVYIKCLFNSESYKSFVNTNSSNTAVSFNNNLEFSFHVPKNLVGRLFEIKVICLASVKNSISGEYEINGTLRPLYKNFISLKDLLPEIKVGEFINAVKESFNMTSVFNQATRTVEFNFLNSFIEKEQVLDLSNYTIDSVARKLNKSIGYKISFSDGEIFNLNKKGKFVTTDTGFTPKRIPIEPLPVLYIDAQANVKHQEGLSMLFFQSNAYAKPLVIDQDISYSRIGFIHTFLRNWLFQNLNSEEYNLTVELPLFLASKLSSESKIWFYNNYFLVHSLKRLNINPLFEKFSLRLLKLKSYPTFNLSIDGDTALQAPIVITTAFSNPYGFSTNATTEFNVTSRSVNFGAPYFAVDIFANGSTDPQNLPLSFGWQVLSSPDGNASGKFSAQNSDHSITRFINKSYFNLAGNYALRLTVVNSVGLSEIVAITVTVT